MKNSPLDLALTQRWMQSVITHPGGVAAGADAEDARGAIDAGIDQMIQPSQSQTSTERLQIYGNAYYARLLECLREEYPAMVHAAGEEAFDGLAFGFLQAHPSTSYTLAQLGANFPRYLEETRPTREEGASEPDWADFLIDLARLERAYAEVFDGPGTEDQKLLQPDDLREIPPERWAAVRIVAVPCLRLMTFRYPVHEYASAVRNELSPTPPAAQTTWLAITRRNYIVRRLPLSEIQYALLTALSGGHTLGESIEASLGVGDEIPENLAGSLSQWFTDWSAAQLFERIA